MHKASKAQIPSESTGNSPVMATKVENVPFRAPSGNIQVIELHMMDMRKYFPLTAASGLCIRGILYPVMLIRTRLQVQKHNTFYNGTFDAFRKIVKYEGFSGLYKGFWVSNLMIVSQMAYISTYEGVRHHLFHNTSVTENRLRSLVAGFCASMVGQTFLVPIDIVSQHLQTLGKTSKSGFRGQFKSKLNIPQGAFKSNLSLTKAVINAVYKNNGVLGFYKGYMASIAVYAPNSAMWWFFYDIYCDMIGAAAPDWVPRLMLQCVAAPMGGITTSVLTNPLDAIRARIQVDGLKFGETTRMLWKEEHMKIFTKGLSARLIQSISFSFFIILGYETVKRWSLLDEYKDHVSW